MTSKENQQRFQALLTQHKGILFKISHSYCRNPADREDLEQAISLQLWRSFSTFDESARFSTWMYRVALNVAISFYRRESTRNRHVVPGDEPLLQAVAEPAGPSEEIKLLYQFIERLDPLNKALVLLYLDGNTYKEIAGVLGITESNAATKLDRLKKAIKQENET